MCVFCADVLGLPGLRDGEAKKWGDTETAYGPHPIFLGADPLLFVLWGSA